MFDDIHTVQTEGIANVGIDVNSDKCVFLDTKLYQHMVIKAATRRKLTNPSVYIIVGRCLVIKLKDRMMNVTNISTKHNAVHSRLLLKYLFVFGQIIHHF